MTCNQQVKVKHDNLTEQGLLKGSLTKLKLIDSATSKRSKAYRIPIALQLTADKGLDRLVDRGAQLSTVVGPLACYLFPNQMERFRPVEISNQQ